MRQIVAALILMLGLMQPASAQNVTAVRTLAEQGDAEAQFALGTMYRDGQGVARDYAEALRWWRSAAELGLLDAKLALGNIHAGGTGVARDNILAYKWYELATLQSGDDWLRGIARSNRDAVAARMTLADISKARRLVGEWTAKHGK
jgi:TPR repeat protein